MRALAFAACGLLLAGCGASSALSKAIGMPGLGGMPTSACIVLGVGSCSVQASPPPITLRDFGPPLGRPQ